MAETLMDAVNAALGEAGNAPPDVEDSNAGADDTGDDVGSGAPEGDSDATGSPESDDKGGESGEEDAGEGEPSGEPSEDVAAEAAKLGVSTKRENGQFKSKEELAADVAAAKAAAGKGDKPADGADKKGKQEKPKKEPDALNDPIPKDVKAETQQRIRTLIDRTKKAEETATQAQQNFDYLVNGVKATGTTPQQYSELLSFMQLFNSGDPQQQTQALDLLEGVADRLATLLGRERKVNDPLTGHADLLAKVQAGRLAKEDAMEIARARNQGQFRTTLQSSAVEAQNQERAFQQEKEQARVDLNALEQRLQANDPLYDRKREAILPTFKAALQRIRPSQWAQTFNDIYTQARVQAPVRQVRTGVPTNQPMRAGKNPSGTGGGSTMASQPNSALDAVNAALASMGK